MEENTKSRPQCQRCNFPAKPGKSCCARCLEEMALYNRERYVPTGNPAGRPRKY